MNKNQARRLTKTLRYVTKEDTWENTLSEDFQSSALYVRRLSRRLSRSNPKSDSDLTNKHIQKRSNGFKTEKMSGR